MAYSVVPKTRRDGKITLIDGASPTPTELEVAYEEGNLSFDIPDEYSSLVIRDRGDICAVRTQDQNIITGTFSFDLRQFTDASEAGSVIDFIDKAGNYSGNISTGASGTPYIEQYCIDIKYDVEGTDHGDDADHSATLSKCIIDSYSVAEGDPTRVTINFSCYGGYTYTGPA
jgi:hypothetical protein